ncbi:uncharacterized protein I206_106744 [Kwoniella pini CBS 10737]|uniref:Uncharacterized protein n=1 Tax=Kwoniella pini CBS 10737 TaxID=1296096 RepID=A0A1B9HTB8_9TREE|nr:uncharacterized protein I206_07368 [Kwoniella pini CBS 10737]OCF46515.1 hypothetical protein I206_07368 [Kwoniella pini CBS 10737]
MSYTGSQPVSSAGQVFRDTSTGRPFTVDSMGKSQWVDTPYHNPNDTVVPGNYYSPRNGPLPASSSFAYGPSTDSPVSRDPMFNPRYNPQAKETGSGSVSESASRSISKDTKTVHYEVKKTDENTYEFRKHKDSKVPSFFFRSGENPDNQDELGISYIGPSNDSAFVYDINFKFIMKRDWFNHDEDKVNEEIVSAAINGMSEIYKKQPIEIQNEVLKYSFEESINNVRSQRRTIANWLKGTA